MLKAQSRAPEFKVTSATDGRSVSLSELRGRHIVLFFFPKAFTRLWTNEATRFRDAYKAIQAMGAEVIGASTDTPETQREFAESLSVPYPMVGDVDRRLSSSFDVLWPLVRIARRVTYVIDHAGIIRGVFPFELKEEKHIEETLRLLDTLERERKQAAAKA